MIRAVDENVRLDAAERHRLIDGAIANLKQHYIYPDAAQKMADALLAHERAAMTTRRRMARPLPLY